MKIVAGLIGLTTATERWPGFNFPNQTETYCGNVVSGDVMTNSTCTLAGANVRVAQYNGGYLTADGAVTAYGEDAMISSAVVFYDQDPSTAKADNNYEMDNTTCWQASFACTGDLGAPYDGVTLAVDNTVWNEGYVLFRFAGYKAASSITFSVNDMFGQAVDVTNASVAADHSASVSGNTVVVNIDSSSSFSDEINVNCYVGAGAHIPSTVFSSN